MTTKKVYSEDDKIVNTDGIESLVEKEIIPPQEQFTNGDCETWSEGAPTGFDLQLDTGSVEQSTDSHAGTYAIKIISSEAPGTPSAIGIGKTGLTPGETLTHSVWGKIVYNEDPPTEANYFLYNGPLATATHFWIEPNSGWQAMNSPGTIDPGESYDGLGSDQTTYTERSGTIQSPDSGEIWLYTQVLGPGGIGYFDDFSLKTEESSSPAEFYKIKLKNTLAELTPQDIVFQVLDSEDQEVMSFNGKGVKPFIVDSNSFSTPPTDAELDAEFGTPSEVGSCFEAIIDVGGAGTNVYRVISDGVNWLYNSLSVAS